MLQVLASCHPLACPRRPDIRAILLREQLLLKLRTEELTNSMGSRPSSVILAVVMPPGMLIRQPREHTSFHDFYSDSEEVIAQEPELEFRVAKGKLTSLAKMRPPGARLGGQTSRKLISIIAILLNTEFAIRALRFAFVEPAMSICKPSNERHLAILHVTNGKRVSMMQNRT